METLPLSAVQPQLLGDWASSRSRPRVRAARVRKVRKHKQLSGRGLLAFPDFSHLRGPAVGRARDRLRVRSS